MRITDLTEEQRLVLLNAVEESALFSLLDEYAPGTDLQLKLPYVPQLSQLVLDFMNKGLVSLYKNSDEPGYPVIDIPDDEARAIIANPDSWWSAEGGLPVSLAPTEKGRALYQGEEVDGDR